MQSDFMLCIMLVSFVLFVLVFLFFFFFSSRRRHTRCLSDWSSDVCSSDLREGVPLGYELFAGNRNDVTTLEEIVERIERLYGKANRIWVMDRGMISEENVRYLKEAGRRYIVGTPKGMLRRFERELLAQDWHQVHTGLEVRFCPAPGGEEIFLLCRSAQRRGKDRGIRERFVKRIEEGLEKIAASCRKRKQESLVIAQRVGRLLGRNSRAAGAFEVQIEPDAQGF